jgi:hypothetical protein
MTLICTREVFKEDLLHFRCEEKPDDDALGEQRQCILLSHRAAEAVSVDQ